MPSAAELLGPDGPLARSLPAYEARPAQLEMARAELGKRGAALDRALGRVRVPTNTNDKGAEP